MQLNQEHLFNLTIINKIPFNKVKSPMIQYEEFIKKEYNTITTSIKKKQEMKKQRFDTVIS